IIATLHSATLTDAQLAANYGITNAGATFTINARSATWTTNDNSKTYGNADPNPLTLGSGTFLPADGVYAVYTRVSGESAGSYHITATLHSLTLSDAQLALNYAPITNTGATFTINKRTVNVAVSATPGTINEGQTTTLTVTVTDTSGAALGNVDPSG